MVLTIAPGPEKGHSLDSNSVQKLGSARALQEIQHNSQNYGSGSAGLTQCLVPSPTYKPVSTCPHTSQGHQLDRTGKGHCSGPAQQSGHSPGFPQGSSSPLTWGHCACTADLVLPRRPRVCTQEHFLQSGLPSVPERGNSFSKSYRPSVFSFPWPLGRGGGVGSLRGAGREASVGAARQTPESLLPLSVRRCRPKSSFLPSPMAHSDPASHWLGRPPPAVPGHTLTATWAVYL